MTIRDNRDYLRVLLYSYYTTITGWGVLLRYSRQNFKKKVRMAAVKVRLSRDEPAARSVLAGSQGAKKYDKNVDDTGSYTVLGEKAF